MDDFGEDGGGFAPMADGGDDPFADDQAGDPFAAGGDGEAADPFADGVEGGAVDPFAEGGTTDAFGEEAVEQADPFAAAGASMPMSSGAGEDDTEAQQALLREHQFARGKEMKAKEELEQEKLAARKAEAQAKLKAWTDERKDKNTRKQKDNRTDEAEKLRSAKDAKETGSNSWHRVVSLIDTSADSDPEKRDVTRMKELLIQLKHTPPHASVSG